MITIMNSLNKPMKETDNCLDSQLWHSCAGGMVQMPPLNSKVFYFPQGHAEHVNGTFDFRNFPRIPALILCRLSAIKYLADTETDEVYAKIRLVPLRNNDYTFEDDDYDDDDDGVLGMNTIENQEKPASFAKTLTQSDANNGGGFSVPRYCAETIFPRLDYTAEPPVQKILAKDVHGEIWQFRHIYRGTPRRHLLTTGWSNFVNRKKLVTGDSIVFLRADNGDLCVGIRRAKGGIGGGPEAPSGWNTIARNSVSTFLKEDENSKLLRNGSYNVGLKGKGRVRDESVIEAANLVASGQPFEVVYYPRASTPEFFVKASTLTAAMRIQWCSGMRFKMAFETEDSSRISWFMGTISDVHVDDPVRWPNSPWRLLQVAWDEPDLLQNVKRVNPWLVELVSNMPTHHLNPFSLPRKKMRLPQPTDFPLVGQFPMPSLLSNPLLGPNTPLCSLPDNIPAGIQGARHTQFQSSSSSSSLDLHLKNLHSGFFLVGTFIDNPESNENISCFLTIGNPTQSPKKKNEVKKPVFLLFGQPILTEDQMSQSCSGDTVGNSSSYENPEKTSNLSDGSGSAVIQNGPPENSSDGWFPWYKDQTKSEFGLESGHCKVFMEFEDVGRTLDLAALRSYDELYSKLTSMFNIERSEMLSNVLYRDAAGTVKHVGDEPFSEFLKTARRLTILTDSGSDNK